MRPFPSSIKLKREFYLRPTLVVARELLGCLFYRKTGTDLLVGRIVEVEAYPGIGDPASHSFRGQTRRNAAMFRQGGHLYVYFTYGMHFCANVVTESEGTGAAVLIRALEPVRGMKTMTNNRFGRKTTAAKREVLHILCNGPANLCSAMQITRDEDGTDLCGNKVWIGTGEAGRDSVAVSRRVGISKGVSHRWRFFLKDSPFVSRGRPA
jgi:DNA-3-methyladenine glycosylase